MILRRLDFRRIGELPGQLRRGRSLNSRLLLHLILDDVGDRDMSGLDVILNGYLLDAYSISTTRIFLQQVKLEPPLLILQAEGGRWLRLPWVRYPDWIQVLDLQGRGALCRRSTKRIRLAVVERIVQIDIGLRCRNPITEALREDLLLLHLVLHHCHDLVREMTFLLVC